MFSNEINGYNKKEVDNKIDELLKELSAQNKLIQEKNKINISLTTALEKSKEIEASTKNLYNLKMQKILIMYKNLAKSFNNLFSLYPQIEELDDIKKSFDKFTYIVETTFFAKETPKQNINAAVNTENDTIRLLLNKMSSYPQNKEKEDQPIKIKRKDAKTKNSILSSKILETIDDECPADKFLESGKIENNAYAKIINNKRPDDLFPTPNESGFDLKEAVNPKDDLSEIMQAFDFFNEN